MNGLEQDYSEFVEVDPTGRYGRYNEILGKGASKTVYKAFDEYQGVEVAWNQVKLYDFQQSPEDLERLYCEIHLLKTLKHKNIMKFYTSWVDTVNRNINFVTEMFTSGTLRQYRLKHRRVNIRAVKHWCRQILSGLLYLHSHYPPVIHRDLKCDNIFVNGNKGEVKIGDLGLAAILRKYHAARCVGTPEFMAPEVYEEAYNELVDIYAFGMCILEMVTFEYPYSECTHPAQIYKKVTSGKKPEALYNVKDPQVRQFVEKCLATVSRRLTARELLNDPFLQLDDSVSDFGAMGYQRDFDEPGALMRQPLYQNCQNNSALHGYADCFGYEPANVLDYRRLEYQTSEIDIFTCHGDEHLADVDRTIKGRRREDDCIFLRLRIADKEGRIRNIYFPFDIETDTAWSVATEMVSELDITDQDVTKIADMIDGELATLLPDWKGGQCIEERPNGTSASFCHNCASNGYLLNNVSSNSRAPKNLQVVHCSEHGGGAIHGRFEEITYQVDGSEQCVTEGAPVPSCQSDSIHYADIWAQRDGPESSSQESKDIHCNKSHETLNESIFGNEERIISMDDQSVCSARNSSSLNSSTDCGILDDYENEIRRELRWLKAKYQMQLRELRDQKLSLKSKSPSVTPDSDDSENKKDHKNSQSSVITQPTKGNNEHLLKSSTFDAEEKCTKILNQRVMKCEASNGSSSPEKMFTAKSFYTGVLLPHSLHRATSLPVDAVDV